MKSLSKCFPQYTLQTYNKYIIRANNNENKSKEMENKKSCTAKVILLRSFLMSNS